MKPFKQGITATATNIEDLGNANNAIWIQDIAIAHWEAVGCSRPCRRLSLGRWPPRDRLSARWRKKKRN
jgi:hypothetical protein